MNSRRRLQRPFATSREQLEILRVKERRSFRGNDVSAQNIGYLPHQGEHEKQRRLGRMMNFSGKAEFV